MLVRYVNKTVKSLMVLIEHAGFSRYWMLRNYFVLVRFIDRYQIPIVYYVFRSRFFQFVS